MNTLLTALLSPLADYFTTNSTKIDKDAKSSKLFFEDFFLKIFFAQSKSNACKLHLALELNRMIPTEFWIGSGNSCERSFLMSILQKGTTYIADRGYFSFQFVNYSYICLGFLTVVPCNNDVLQHKITQKAILHKINRCNKAF